MLTRQSLVLCGVWAEGPRARRRLCQAPFSLREQPSEGPTHPTVHLTWRFRGLLAILTWESVGYPVVTGLTHPFHQYQSARARPAKLSKYPSTCHSLENGHQAESARSTILIDRQLDKAPGITSVTSYYHRYRYQLYTYN